MSEGAANRLRRSCTRTPNQAAPISGQRRASRARLRRGGPPARPSPSVQCDISFFAHVFDFLTDGLVVLPKRPGRPTPAVARRGEARRPSHAATAEQRCPLAMGPPPYESEQILPYHRK